VKEMLLGFVQVCEEMMLTMSDREGLLVKWNKAKNTLTTSQGIT
jgi:hypothetical protein